MPTKDFNEETMRTLQQQLNQKLGAKIQPIRKVATHSNSTLQVILSKAPLGKLEKPNNCSETTREPEDATLRWNGGDYWFGLDYIDRFSFERTSCELSTGNTEHIAGYYKDRPLIAAVSDCWSAEYALDFGVQIYFIEGSFHNCGHKDWDKVVTSPYWERIGDSSLGISFRRNYEYI